jgi:hypothetical protein
MKKGWNKFVRWAYDWGAILPVVAAGLVATTIVLLPNSRRPTAFPNTSTRDALFARFNTRFDEKRAYVLVSSRCLHTAEENFFFSREAGYSPGDIGAPEVPVWGELTPLGAEPSKCGLFLRELKASSIPFYLFLSTDGRLGEVLAKEVRKYAPGEDFPLVFVETFLVEATAPAIEAALQK